MYPANQTPIAGGADPASTNAASFETVIENRPSPILIVDDEPFVADLIQHWVQNVWDYPTVIAHSGEAAIIAMREHHPRMVLLDINLPDINGVDVLRALKSAD